MNNQFFNQMFSPQYFNRNYYYTCCPQQPQFMPPTWVQQQQQEECRQQEEVAKVVKAFDDMIKAAQKLDAQHQQIAFCACLNLLAAEQKWK